MTLEQSASLQLPSFLHGTFRSARQKAKREGLRCGEQYHEDGTFLAPRQMVAVPPGEVVVVHEVVDFQRERPAWRLYMVSHVMVALSEPPQSSIPVRRDYEALFRETAWGALFFATTHMGPVSAQSTAKRLQAVLRFWEPLQGARYLFKKLGEAHTLEELMVASCDWAMAAWCPGEDAPVRERLALAVDRMARATREDCIEAICREMPRALAHVGKLKHRSVVADPAFQRERLATLDPRAFERVSGALTGEIMSLLLDWDHELGMQ
ncbi:hypothetical protein ATI61_112153 [Archangium gephyra]|uniref:Uncharacterized protein n=1 Tax=Archangium gephyra TaxID=48 RepID=A0AAC8Q4D5_9BACT|nr:hypothetical protein [Archangium gephyra]AKJ00890.1 Hypothetical protein AA314_02516 [Archangium gephyra]REG26058.1 hypothetical protein ATI61_112153 [Archangium gephyra]